MILYRPVGTKELRLIERNNNDDHKGYVTKFEVDDIYCIQFEVHQVGAKYHKELWIPAKRLEEFSEHIIGKISIITEFSNN